MTNKPMLSVERELRAAVEQALLAMKRIYQAGYDGIIAAGGSCDQPGVMFEGDPTARELRALLDKPNAWPCWSCKEMVSMGERAEADGYCPHCSVELDIEDWPFLEKPAAHHQGEPVAHLSLCLKGPNRGDYIIVTALGASGNDVWSPDIPVYAEQPAPVAVVMPERKGANHKDWRDWTQEEIGYNKALDDVARLNGVNS